MAADEINKSTTEMTVTEFAEHIGVTKGAVSRAISNGRLTEKSIGYRGGRPYIKDIALADQEWAANTQGSSRTLNQIGEAGVPPIAVSRARREAALAGLATIELLEKKGKVVSIDGVRLAVAEKFTAVKTKILGLPSRIKQRLPHIAASDVREIDNLIREALEDLAGGIK